jgi:hypothetical protein
MRKLSTRLIVAFMTCTLGIGAAAIWSSSRNSTPTNDQCREDLVVIERQPEAPVSLSVLKLDCPNPYFADISFQVTKVSTRRIKQYDVRMLTTYDGIAESYSEVVSGFDTVEPDEPDFYLHQEKQEFLGISFKHGFLRTPKAQLKLFVWSVTFADGTVWKRASQSE